ncbi:hypothetical protein BGZ65_001634 [Modicella reniformis]|uniref:Ion transport domain-containing protein n=1 Tax=Modicella reniformis TaxID=1440133 RepID=A0A9P6M9Z9_9FUNG|nr:hypothetical protein BGZ65_001634 [Modicella reniformis]
MHLDLLNPETERKPVNAVLPPLLNDKGRGTFHSQSNQSTTTIEGPKKSAFLSNAHNRVLTIGEDKTQEIKSGKNNTQTSFFKRSIALRKGSQKGEDKWPKVITVLTLLLNQLDLKEANHIFIEGLLGTADHEWIPHGNIRLNPIFFTIKYRHGELLEILISYCIRNAKAYHPAYLIPAVQCLNGLLKFYPDVLRDLFQKASYIPAPYPEYITSHAIIANTQFIRSMFGFSKPTNINQDRDPVFILRSQLPCYYTQNILVRISFARLRGRVTSFPAKRDEEQTQPTHMNRSRKIFVSPLTFRFKESILVQIAGRNFFDSPAIAASLRFKWFTFGVVYWLMYFFLVLLFFILIILVRMEIFLIGVLAVDFGFVLIAHEVLQMKRSPGNYFRSVFNYVDLAGITFPIVGGFLYKDVWIMGFGILFLYLKVLCDLRVIKPLGLAVNIIVNITRRIKWFFLIFGLVLMGFTHVLLFVLKDEPCDDGTDCSDMYPTGFFKALSATFFFLAGRYDSVNTVFKKDLTGFHIIMVLFYFFTAILLLNVLIALMNDAFVASEKEGEIAYLKLLSEVVTDAETYFTLGGLIQRSSNWFPKYIYYCASAEEIEKFQSRFSISDVSSLSPESRFIVESSTTELSKISAIQRRIVSDVDALAEDMSKYTRGQDEMKQELVEMKDLLKELMLEMKTKNAASRE